MRDRLLLSLVLMLFASTLLAEFKSHPPMRPLPEPNDRPLATGPGYFVDPRGDDDADGSRRKPWRSINLALRRLKPGDTLYLRRGVYHERVSIPVSGEPGKPITLRGYRGEVAVIDGGLREFLERPQDSWKPYPDGAELEFVSTRTYPQFNQRPIVSVFPAAGWEPFHGKEDQRPVVLGHFADSMVPLHGYRTEIDFRDHSMLWDVKGKADVAEGVHCGPGLWYNRRTERIHVRLAHTTLIGLGDHAYRGETDPRRIPLAVSGPFGADVLRINGVRHVTIQDVVLRGASGSPLIDLYGSANITLDGLTLFGGSPGLLVKATSELKIVHCAFRGLAAPWSSRASMKYRGTPSYRIISQRNKPESRDCEIAYCEFTDDHDGVWLRYLHNLRFHHNLVDNFNDDGVEVGARKHDHKLFIYQNRISRCLLTFTLHQMDKGESAAEPDPDSGVYITRNVIDLRRGVFRGTPTKPDPTGAYLTAGGTLCGDHGSPVWPHYYFYHNTVLRTDPTWRGYYGFGMGGRATARSKRRVFNNVFAEIKGTPGLNFASGPGDTFVDGNLHWGLLDGPKFKGQFFEKQGRRGAFRRQPYPDGWMKHDLFADPRFTRFTPDPSAPFDVSLRSGSPAIDAGAALPKEWFDPLRAEDSGRPDIGALYHGCPPWRVGVRGRIGLMN